MIGLQGFAGYERAARARALCGLSYGDPGTREAYLKHMYPGDTRTNATQLGATQSSCLLHLRGLLALEGLDDDIRLRGRTVDALEGPYVEHLTMVEALLQEWCRQRGGGLYRWHSADRPEMPPGTLVVIGLGQQTHGLCVLEQADDVIVSSDGGQTDKANHHRPTAIAERTRRLERVGGVWHLSGKPVVWGWR